MNKKTITYEVDINNPPPFSEQEKAELNGHGYQTRMNDILRQAMLEKSVQ